MTSAIYDAFSAQLAPYSQQLDAIFAETKEGQAQQQAPAKSATMPERSYFLCFINRSGSNLLAEALTKTGRMGRPGEVFNPEPVATIARKHGLRSMAEYVDWQLRNNSVGGVYAAKVGIHQLAYLASTDLIATKFPRPVFIYVTRRDVVMQAISLSIAWQTAAWTSKIESLAEPTFDAQGIAGQVRAILENQAGFEAFFSIHDIEPLRLTYELIEEDLQRVLRMVCRKVGIANPGRIKLPSVTLKRQRTTRNEEWAVQFRRLYNDVSASGVPGEENGRTASAPAAVDPGELVTAIRRGLQEKNAVLVDSGIRDLPKDWKGDGPEVNAVARARHWLVSHWLSEGKYARARAMFRPLEGVLPLGEALAFPKLNDEVLERASQHNPRWQEMALALGYAKWRRGAFKEAMKIVQPLMAERPEKEIEHLATELYCDSLFRTGGAGYQEALSAVCEPLVTSEQTHRYPFLYLGHVAFMHPLSRSGGGEEGHLARALSLFAEAATRKQGLVPLSEGVLSVVDPESLPSLAEGPEPEGILGEMRLSDRNDYDTGGEPVLFFACDPIYLREHGLLLVASAARLNERLTCHVHVVDPTNDVDELLDDMRSRFPHVRLNASYEPCLLKHRRPFYASARFLHAARLLELYQAPLFTVDTDLIVEISMQALRELMQGKDLGLMVKSGTPTFPWTEVQAGTAFFSGSRPCLRFLHGVRRAVLSRFARTPDRSLWYVDQNALFAVFAAMKDELSVGNLIAGSRPIYSCYTRKIPRREFTRRKLEEFGLQAVG